MNKSASLRQRPKEFTIKAGDSGTGDVDKAGFVILDRLERPARLRCARVPVRPSDRLLKFHGSLNRIGTMNVRMPSVRNAI